MVTCPIYSLDDPGLFPENEGFLFMTAFFFMHGDWYTEDMLGPLDAFPVLDPATGEVYLEVQAARQRPVHPLAADPGGLHRLLTAYGGGPVVWETEPVCDRPPTLLPVQARRGQATAPATPAA